MPRNLSHKVANWIQRLRFGIVLGLLPLCFVGAQFFAQASLASPVSAGISGTTESAIVQVGATEFSSLQLGDRNITVKALKTQLHSIGYPTSLTPSRHFDQATERIVRDFQTDQGLSVDGIAGANTLARLFVIANSPAPESNRNSAQPEETYGTQLAAPVSSSVVIAERASSGSADSTTLVEKSLMPPDIQQIVDRGKLVVSLLDRDNPPFFMVDKNGQLDGSDVKTAQAIAQALDVDIEFRRSATTFNEVVEEVSQHKADLAVSKISRTLNRAKQNSFSEPYLNLRQGLLLNRLQLAQDSHGQDMTKMVRSLKGKIGVIEDSSYARFAQQNFPQATVVSYPDWSAVIEAVIKGDILAAYRDELEVKKIVLTRPNAALQLQTISLTDTKDSLAVVLPWGSEHLRAFVNQYLETAKDTDELIYTTDGLLDAYSDYFQPG